MRYIDSGRPDAHETLAAFFQNEKARHVVRLRWQTGYFSIDGLAPLLTTIEHLSSNNLPVDAILGSNDRSTLRSHVTELCACLHIPRPQARLGVVAFSGSLYHPKTYHITRNDGTKAAYIGSANLGFAGLSGLNVEAGLILDTREGDPPHILDEIANAVDAWFDGSRHGVTLVAGEADAIALEANGILASVPAPRTAGSGGASTSNRPVRKPLFPFKRHRSSGDINSAEETVTPATTASPREGYPAYVLFAADPDAATTGVQALSGASLPGGSAGIVVRLNKDSARHWYGQDGTANISVPVALISTLRFGLYSRDANSDRKRPRSEFQQIARYVSTNVTFSGEPHNAGIMVYGYTKGDTGHGDTRLVVPAPLVAGLRQQVAAAKLPAVQIGDVAIVEWPTMDDPTIRLTFFDRTTSFSAEVATVLDDAEMAGQVVGKAACWLPSDLSPPWQLPALEPTS